MSQCWPQRVWLTERVSNREPFSGCFQTKNRLRGEQARPLCAEWNRWDESIISSIFSLDGNEGYFKGKGGGGESKCSVGLWNKQKRLDFKVVISSHARPLKCLFQPSRWLLDYDHCPFPQTFSAKPLCKKWKKCTQNKSHKTVICTSRHFKTKPVNSQKRYICVSSPIMISQRQNSHEMIPGSILWLSETWKSSHLLCLLHQRPKRTVFKATQTHTHTYTLHAGLLTVSCLQNFAQD